MLHDKLPNANILNAKKVPKIYPAFHPNIEITRTINPPENYPSDNL